MGSSMILLIKLMSITPSSLWLIERTYMELLDSAYKPTRIKWECIRTHGYLGVSAYMATLTPIRLF